jgi:hypothetical protein
MRQQSNNTEQTQDPQHESEPRYVALAREATLSGLSGLTRDQVIAALKSRIRRDEGYLAYRKATGRHTSYDVQVRVDLQALALVVVWLEELASRRREQLGGCHG